MHDGLVDEPGFLIGNLGEYIKSLQEYTKFRDLILDDDRLRRQFASDASTGNVFRDDVLWMRANTLLNRVLLPDFVYDESRVNAVSNLVFQELDKCTLTYVIRAYFRYAGPRFEADLPFTDIGTLRMLRTNERLNLVRSLRYYTEAGLTASAATMFRSILELRFDTPNSNILAVQPPRPLEDFQTALRLAIGQTAFAFVTIDLESVFRTGYHHVLVPLSGRFASRSPFTILPDVLVTPGDAALATHLFNRLADSPNSPLLKTAVRRYNDAVERPRLEDALLDYVVALESILTYDNAPDVTRRLRQRLAIMIGASAEDRVNVYSQVSKIYDARSKIAHGDEPKESVWTLVTTAEQYLERLLRRLLQSSTKFDANGLDFALVRGDADFA